MTEDAATYRDALEALHQVHVATVEAMALRGARIRVLEDTLTLISAMGGKTLICGSYAPGDDASQAYSLGANRAFEQCADIARAALAKVGATP